MDIEEIAKNIVDAAIKVHRALGPGLLESAYQHCLAHELRKRGLQVDCEADLLEVAGLSAGLPAQLERPADEARHQTDGQQAVG